MMRYARGSRLVQGAYWATQKVALDMNLVALQRDVLKERRDRLKSDPTLTHDRKEELMEIRKQIQIIDCKWSRSRQRDDLDVRKRPLITSDEWRKLIVAKQIVDDWEQWNGKESNDQWYALERIGCLEEVGPQRPAPGVAEEGSGEDALGIDDFLGCIATRIGLRIPVLPPSTKAKSKAPYDVMPQESDPASR